MRNQAKSELRKIVKINQGNNVMHFLWLGTNLLTDFVNSGKESGCTAEFDKTTITLWNTAIFPCNVQNLNIRLKPLDVFEANTN